MPCCDCFVFVFGSVRFIWLYGLLVVVPATKEFFGFVLVRITEVGDREKEGDRDGVM